MCHTCIAHNPDYCQSCLKYNYRNSSLYESSQELIRVTIFSAIITSLAGCYLYYDSQLSTKTLVCIFYFSFSVASTHYLMKGTDFLSSIRKIPFIGFKLSIALLILIIVTGIPVFYILFKSIKVLKYFYSKRVKIPSR